MTEGGSERLVVDDLAFDVRRSARRRTLELTVDRSGQLLITSPPGVADEVLADFVREKRFWLYTKLAQKSALQRPVAEKEFVSGEGFAYLGRSHRLLLVDSQDVPLKLECGRFTMVRAEAMNGRQHFVRWYTERARTWLRQRIEGWSSRMGVHPASIEVRDLGFRWGSCGQAGGVNFHWATILLPPTIVDYVIVHELAHLIEPNHTPEFWLRVGRAIPDFEQRKVWLAEHGMEAAVT